MAATQSDNVDQPACQEKENENYSNQTVQDKANQAQGIGASQKKLKEKVSSYSHNFTNKPALFS